MKNGEGRSRRWHHGAKGDTGCCLPKGVSPAGPCPGRKGEGPCSGGNPRGGGVADLSSLRPPRPWRPARQPRCVRRRRGASGRGRTRAGGGVGGRRSGRSPRPGGVRLREVREVLLDGRLGRGRGPRTRLRELEGVRRKGLDEGVVVRSSLRRTTPPAARTRSAGRTNWPSSSVPRISTPPNCSVTTTMCRLQAVEGFG